MIRIDLEADKMPFQTMCRHRCRAAAHEWIKHDTTDPDNLP